MTAELRNKLETDARQLLAAAEGIVERAAGKPLSIEQEVEVELALARREQLAKRAKSIPVTVKEPDLYRRNGEFSWVADTIAVRPFASAIPGLNPAAARQRLQRHEAFETERVVKRQTDAIRAAAANGIETRDLAAATGAGSSFSPPRWLVSEYGSVVKAASPLRRLLAVQPLVSGTMVLNIPRFDVEVGVVPQVPENTNVADSIDGATDAISANVATFSGSAAVSRQWIEQGPALDGLVAREFGALYGAALEAELVNGPGTASRMLGLLNVSTSAISAGVPGALAQVYADASPTAAKAAQAIAQLIGVQGATRKQMPSILLARPERIAWLLGSLDTNGDPLQRPGTGGVGGKAPADGPFGPIILPLYADPTLPVDLGAGGNQDIVVSVLLSDILLFEEDVPHFTPVADTSTGAAGMQIDLVFHTYAAAFTNRQPSGVGTVTGTGFVVPSGW